MRRLVEELADALKSLGDVNPLIRLSLWVLWFLQIQGPSSSMGLRVFLMLAFTILVGVFEYKHSLNR